MKRIVLPILSTVVLIGMAGSCKSSNQHEPQQTQTPTERTETEETTTPESRAEAGTQNNDQLRAQVEKALQGQEGLDATEIRVRVDENGIVHLAGVVGSEEEKRRAHEIAHGIPGVINVYIGELVVDTQRAQR